MTGGQAERPGHPVKVAVLGGGIAAMAAAFELTAPELGGRYEVTVYQPGWRLGGKCASGRGSPGSRIEEHGLHVWFGFYVNAFKLIQRCYADWDAPPGSPIKTWQDAFSKCNDVVLFEKWQRQWWPWRLSLPSDDLDPGSRDEVTAGQFLVRVIGFLLTELDVFREPNAGEASATSPPSDGALHHRLISRATAELEHGAERARHDAITLALKFARAIAALHAQLLGRQAEPHRLHAKLVERLLSSVRCVLFRYLLDEESDDPRERRLAVMLDFCATVVTGMLADDVVEKGFGQLNDTDLRAWMKRHGADRATLGAPIVQALYDLVFAYRDGDKHHPDLAGGKALQALIRIFCEYKGAVLWKMQGGMGDTVFAPLYDVLSCRGVRFRFFHQVTDLGVSNDGRSVETIEVQPQVRLNGSSYDPIVNVGCLRCWPSEPKWEEIENGDELQAQHVNFEQQCNPLGLESITLCADRDFDQVVLGISVGALPGICGDLAAASEPFRLMLENSHTVMSEGIQLWLAQPASRLGWPYESSVTTAYVRESDTYSNMSQLLARERWPGPTCPEEVVYLCGVLNHAGVATQADADARVHDNGLLFLRNAACRLWPGAADGSGEFDWSTLFDPSDRQGVDRFEAQFVRANFQPTERYVMTRANTVQYRLRTDESGFANLKLAGDWTRNGLDGGSVEAAVTSGMQAARAISGRPSHIPGETGWLVDD